MSKYTIIVKDAESGEELFERTAATVIAGVSIGEDADVLFIPSGDEDEAAALIGACEDAFGGIMGDNDEDEEF